MHSNIMAGKSDYFFNKLLNAAEHDTFADYMAFNNSCQLNIDSDAVEAIITFCYTGTVELTVDNVDSVYDGANQLQIESLIILCCDMLEDTLDITNCIRYLDIADKQRLHGLKESALEIISEELPHINRLPEFYLLNGPQMSRLIELLSSSQNGIFDKLQESLNAAEKMFFSMHLFDGNDTQRAMRAAVRIVNHTSKII